MLYFLKWVIFEICYMIERDCHWLKDSRIYMASQLRDVININMTNHSPLIVAGFYFRLSMLNLPIQGYVIKICVLISSEIY